MLFSKCPLKQAISSLHSNAHSSQAVADNSNNNIELGGGAPGVRAWPGAEGGVITPAAAGATPPAAGAGATVAAACGQDSLPAVFFCPITQEVMKDPVLAADGYSYERSAIEQWFHTHDTSPMSNQRLPNKSLTTNHALRSSIRDAVPNLE